MSTIRVETITNSSGTQSISQTTVFSGTAKAWSMMDGVSTLYGVDDFNFASYTDNGTGSYDCNYSSAMQIASSYANFAQYNYAPGAGENDYIGMSDGNSTAHITVSVGYSSASVHRTMQDNTQSALIFGDLA